MTGSVPGAGAGGALLRREPGVTAPLPVRQAAARAVRTSAAVDPLLLARVAAALRRLPGREPEGPHDEVPSGECPVFARWRMEAR